MKFTIMKFPLIFILIPGFIITTTSVSAKPSSCNYSAITSPEKKSVEILENMYDVQSKLKLAQNNLDEINYQRAKGYDVYSSASVSEYNKLVNKYNDVVKHKNNLSNQYNQLKTSYNMITEAFPVSTNNTFVFCINSQLFDLEINTMNLNTDHLNIETDNLTINTENLRRNADNLNY